MSQRIRIFFFSLVFYLFFSISDLCLVKAKYAGREKEKVKENDGGLSSIDKVLLVDGARISYSIWEVGGNFSKKIILFSDLAHLSPH